MPQQFRRHILVNIGIILGSFVAFGTIFYFVSQALAEKTTQILDERKEIALRAGDLENLARLKTHAVAAADLEKKIDLLLPSQDGLIAFPQFMTTMARNRSVSIVFNFSASPVAPTETSPGYATFNAAVEGPADNIRGFLDDIENHSPKFLVNVQHFSLILQAGSYHADMDGKVYFRANETP